MPENTEAVSVSQYLQDLISSNSELGSRLLSLLLVSSGNGKEIMDAINRGDLDSIRNLDLAVDFKMPMGSPPTAAGTSKDISQSSPEESPQAESQVNSQRVDSALARQELASISAHQPSEDGSYSKIDKRKRNTEASARFRVRKRQREHEKLNKLKELNVKVSELYKKIDVLLEENQHWKQELEKLNERKSKEMLDRIKKRNATSP